MGAKRMCHPWRQRVDRAADAQRIPREERRTARAVTTRRGRCCGTFQHATIDHNYRHKNALADKLANLAMDRKGEVTEVDGGGGAGICRGGRGRGWADGGAAGGGRTTGSVCLRAVRVCAAGGGAVEDAAAPAQAVRVPVREPDGAGGVGVALAHPECAEAGVRRRVSWRLGAAVVGAWGAQGAGVGLLCWRVLRRRPTESSRTLTRRPSR